MYQFGTHFARHCLDYSNGTKFMIRLKLIHNRKGKLNKEGKALIQLRAYLEGKNKFFSTGIYVKPIHWSKKAAKVVGITNSNEYNHLLNKKLQQLEEFCLNSTRKQGAVTLEQLETFWKSSKYDSFTAFIGTELEQDQKRASSTVDNNKGSLRHWQAFRKDVLFSEINYTLIDAFDQYLRGHKLKTNSIHKHHRVIRRFINLAIKKNLLESQDNPYLQFELKREETKRIVLSKEEVTILEKLEIPKDLSRLEQVRDIFLFSCYTGLRCSDALSIKKENLEQTSKGLLLHIRAQKTKKLLTLPLYTLHDGKPAQILEKYWDRPYRIFSISSGQYLNRELKKLAKLANINKAVTSHVARHTFATHLALKVPLHILQRLLQHGKIETTMVYVHLSNQIINDELGKVDW